MKIVGFIFSLVSLNLPMGSLAASECTTGFDSFKQNFYPKLRANCVNCHVDGELGPPHSDDDKNLAYKESLIHANFTNIPASNFLSLVKDKHWIDYEENPGDEKGMTVAEMTKALNAWYYNGQNECKAVFAQVTTKVQLPQDLPTRESGQFNTLQFDLSKSIPEVNKKTILEIQIQEFSKRDADYPRSFLLKNPRIATLDNISFDGFQIIVNGRTNPYETAYSALKKELRGKPFKMEDEAKPFPILSSRTQVVVERKGKQAQEISFAFNNLALSRKSYDCLNSDYFKASVIPLFEQFNCHSCHNDDSNKASSRLSMKNSPKELCLEIQDRINDKNLNQSLLFKYTISGINRHEKLRFFQGKKFSQVISKWRKEKEREKLTSLSATQNEVINL